MSSMALKHRHYQSMLLIYFFKLGSFFILLLHIHCKKNGKCHLNKKKQSHLCIYKLHLHLGIDSLRYFTDTAFSYLLNKWCLFLSQISDNIFATLYLVFTYAAVNGKNPPLLNVLFVHLLLLLYNGAINIQLQGFIFLV